MYLVDDFFSFWRHQLACMHSVSFS